MRVLEIGTDLKPQARFIPGWEDADVVTLDVREEMKPDIVADARRLPEAMRESYDGLLASHVLEHFAWWDVQEVLKSWVAVLKPGGELHVVVPSLEWAAKQILSETPSRALMPLLYAGIQHQHDIHLAGFTMRYLRALMERVGVGVVAARSGAYSIVVAGEYERAEQHYVKGIKK